MSQADREYPVEIAAIEIPETRTFAHTTRLVDFDTPAMEEIIRPAATLRAHTARVRLWQGETATHADTRPVPEPLVDRLKHEVKRVLHRRAPTVDLGPQTIGFDLRAHFLNNHAHLVHECLAPLRCLEATLESNGSLEGRSVSVILGVDPPKLVSRFLEAAGVPVVEADGIVRGTLVSIEGHHDVSLVPYLSRQPWSDWAEATPSRVYVSRRGELRSVVNEDEVKAMLEAEGYERVFMEDYPLPQQWSMLVNAEEIVGIHGAGLAGIAFAAAKGAPVRPRVRVVELYSAGYSNSCFRDYTAGVDGVWVGVRGKILPEIVDDLDIKGNQRAHHMSCFEVDLVSLGAALARMRSL